MLLMNEDSLETLVREIFEIAQKEVKEEMMKENKGRVRTSQDGDCCGKDCRTEIN